MPTYDVFLSHAGADKPAVEALAQKLRDEAGLRVFFDRWELVPGRPWQEALEKALAASRTCAVFLGPEGLGPWHTAEMRVALGQRVEKEPKRVIPVLLPGADESAIPGFLAERTWVDFRAGLDDEAAFSRLVAGIRGVAPGSPEGGQMRSAGAQAASDVKDPATVASPPTEDGGAQLSEDELPWWRRNRLACLGIAIGIVGALLTTAAWLWPRAPEPPPPESPALYALRVQVLDPDGQPVEGSEVRASAGNEPQRLPDGWWEVEIPGAKVPADRKITVWAEHTRWQGGRADLQLGEDPNPRAEIALRVPESRIRGVVVDAAERGVAGARVSARSHDAQSVVTDQDGRFELTVAAPREQSVRIHVEHDEFPPKDTFCYAGSDGCVVVVGDS